MPETHHFNMNTGEILPEEIEQMVCAGPGFSGSLYGDLKGVDACFAKAMAEQPDGGTTIDLSLDAGLTAAKIHTATREAGKRHKIYAAVECINPSVLVELANNLIENYADSVAIVAGPDENRLPTLFKTNSADFVFVNGHPTWAWLIPRLMYWWPIVRDGGWLCGFNYWNGHIEVDKAVQCFFQTPDASWHGADGVWGIRKDDCPGDPGPAKTPIGIGVITHNRLEQLQGCIAAIRRHTKIPYELMVADDGSTDGTQKWCRDSGLRTVTGARIGCAGNKNRALLGLKTYTNADPFVLIEDDAWPSTDDWAESWSNMGRRFGHVSYHDPVQGQMPYEGNGNPDKPLHCVTTTGHVLALNRQTLSLVGYIDPRFTDVGFDHVEWTYRMARAGVYGAKERLCSNYGIRLVASRSWATGDGMERSRQLMETIALGNIYRSPSMDLSNANRMEDECRHALQ